MRVLPLCLPILFALFMTGREAAARDNCDILVFEHLDSAGDLRVDQ
jgi:hypothetical protein